MYKLYSSILNTRLSLWSESNGILVSAENGFRKTRSTIDHVSTLTNIIDTRKKLKRSTFCTFIDFRKAYDFIDRVKLWKNIWHKYRWSLYISVSSCIRINGYNTDWFEVSSGLRQGCSLSPLLFNLFVNDLALHIKSLGKGIDIDNERVCILLYADDLVLLSENEKDLQFMLDAFHGWCKNNNMYVTDKKSNIVYFRPPALPKSEFVWRRCDIHVYSRQVRVSRYHFD